MASLNDIKLYSKLSVNKTSCWVCEECGLALHFHFGQLIAFHDIAAVLFGLRRMLWKGVSF